MFCLVAITYTSPKVSVTASKRVPGEKREGPRGFKFKICIKSTEHFLELDWLAILENKYIFFVLISQIFFSICKNWLRGLLRE